MSFEDDMEPLVGEDADATNWPCFDSSERHFTKRCAKLGFVGAAVAFVAVAVHVVHYAPKQSVVPRGMTKFFDEPNWSYDVRDQDADDGDGDYGDAGDYGSDGDDGDDGGGVYDLDDGSNGTDGDGGFGFLEPTELGHEAHADGFGKGFASNATNGRAPNDGNAPEETASDWGVSERDENLGPWEDDWTQGPQGPQGHGYGDAWGASSNAEVWDQEIAGTTTTTTVHFYPQVPAIMQYVNHYDPANPLKIEVKANREDNYFLILGDWGKAGGPGSCQLAVATMLRAYVTQQSLAGKHLLFIASVGDNFYWTGATPEAWERTWSQPYGVHDPNSPVYQIPWLSLYGNHDFGNNDPHAFCPHLYPRKMVQGQPYSSHQLNRDKFPDRPHLADKYWLPDYNYHYEIPEADLEVIVVDTNGKVDPNIIGGDAGGRNDADTNCSGQATTQDFLSKLAESGDSLVVERAQKNTAGTVLLLQHYPDKCPRTTFEDSLPPSRKGKVKVLCAYGHEHTQACNHKDESGLCIEILTGGGGGCCGPLVDLAGFTAVHLDSGSGVASVDVESSSVRLPAGSCKW